MSVTVHAHPGEAATVLHEETTMAVDVRTTPERLEIRPGASVKARDKEIGKVDRVVVAPGTDAVVALIVRKGLILRRAVVIPIEAVEDADDDNVQLSISATDVEHLPEYREEDFVAAPAGWHSPVDTGTTDAHGVVFRRSDQAAVRGLQPVGVGQAPATRGGRPLRAGMKVVCRDGEIGKLDLVLVDPQSRRATYLVVRRGGLLGRDTVIPVDWAAEIGPDRIYLDVPKEVLNELPEYRPDFEIWVDVLDALWSSKEILPAELAFVEVQVHDGVVELLGHTTPEAKQKIEEAARRVRSVLGVRNRLDTVPALPARSLARA
jgi:uncharacterized protein YrrD